MEPACTLESFSTSFPSGHSTDISAGSLSLKRTIENIIEFEGTTNFPRSEHEINILDFYLCTRALD